VLNGYAVKILASKFLVITGMMTNTVAVTLMYDYTAKLSAFGIGVARNLSWGTLLDLSNFPGGRMEVPKAPMGVECGEVCPLPTGVGSGLVPPPQKFLVFDLKMVN